MRFVIDSGSFFLKKMEDTWQQEHFSLAIKDFLLRD